MQTELSLNTDFYTYACIWFTCSHCVLVIVAAIGNATATEVHVIIPLPMHSYLQNSHSSIIISCQSTTVN